MSNAALRAPRLAVVLMLATAVLIGGCGQDDAPDAAASVDTADLPDWIERVHPEPGAEASATPQVQVVHGVVGPDEGVRLHVDGIDVTSYAGPRAGVLAYDPNQSQAPVELGPGTHEASVQRVSLDEFGAQHEVLESFEWEFTLQ